eukprot:2924230-Alexandrium_andersonii.AAC.1
MQPKGIAFPHPGHAGFPLCMSKYGSQELGLGCNQCTASRLRPYHFGSSARAEEKETVRSRSLYAFAIALCAFPLHP